MARRPNRVHLAAGEAWRSFYATPQGRAAMADLMIWANVYSPIETNDPIEMARLNGERNVVMRIALLMGLKPGDYLQQAQDDTDIVDRMMRSN